MKKLKSSVEHQYNLFSGFRIAIEIAFIVKFLDILRLVILENKIYWIDLGILIFLFFTAFCEEIITKTLFVDKRIKPNLSKKQKGILWLVVLIYITMLIVLLLWLIPIFISVKLV